MAGPKGEPGDPAVIDHQEIANIILEDFTVQKGERGEKGGIGLAGLTGKEGINGRDGLPGRQGLVGAVGPKVCGIMCSCSL